MALQRGLGFKMKYTLKFLLQKRLVQVLKIWYVAFPGSWGWSGGAMALGKLPVPGRPTIWTVGQGPIALAVGAGWGLFGLFTLLYPFSPLSPSLWQTALYRLKYCLKGPLNPKQQQILVVIYQVGVVGWCDGAG